MGISFADLRFSGISPVDNDKFKIHVKGVAMSLAPSVMTLGDNRSNPVALLEFSLHKILSTLFSLTSLKRKLLLVNCILYTRNLKSTGLL